ncbi:MAG: CsbD family protein [Proteobacteria bacterium]|nr:CsbD family protein [Pseudomonadota bacterium]
MDKEHVKDAADKTSGATRDAAGKGTGSEKLRAEGQMNKAKGVAREFMSDGRDAARKTDKRDVKH